MKKLLLTVILVIIASFVPTIAKSPVIEVCGAGYINENGCVAKQCRVCEAGHCFGSYEVVIHCPGDQK